MKTDQIQKVHKDWYKLDLSAIVYPTLQRRDFSSVSQSPQPFGKLHDTGLVTYTN